VQLKQRDHEDRGLERERKNKTFVENFMPKEKWFGDKNKERSITNDNKAVIYKYINKSNYFTIRKWQIQMINSQFLLGPLMNNLNIFNLMNNCINKII